jgi:hypothetical protein
MGCHRTRDVPRLVWVLRGMVSEVLLSDDSDSVVFASDFVVGYRVFSDAPVSKLASLGVARDNVLVVRRSDTRHGQSRSRADGGIPTGRRPRAGDRVWLR